MREAERLGYDSVWTAEAYGSDAATILGWLARPDVDDQARLGDLPDARPRAGDDGDDRGDARPALRRADAARHRLERAAGRRGLARRSASAASCSGRASTSRSCGWRWRASGSSSTARRSSCRCPTGPGKALKLTIAPVQERIPIYLAAIGPEEHDAGRRDRRRLDADRSFSPEHVGEFRPLLEEGFARAGGGKGFDDFDIAPTVNVCVDDDLDVRARRDARRYVALYVGGMGSREQELLQPARRSATASRTPRARSRTSTWRARRRRRWRRCPAS